MNRFHLNTICNESLLRNHYRFSSHIVNCCISFSQVLSYTATNDQPSTTDAVAETTFPKPNPVQQVVGESTDRTLAVTWEPPTDMSIIQHMIQYAAAGSVTDTVSSKHQKQSADSV